MTGLSVLPTPAEWLAQTARERRISHNRLSRLLGVDKSRFAKWVANKEQIPRAHLAELAQQMPPTDITYLLRLKDCEDFADQLRRRAQRLCNDLGLGDRAVEVLFRYVEKLAAQDQPPGSPACAGTLIRHLIDATAAVQIAHQAVETGFVRPLLPPESVPRFYYPVNHYLGLLIDLDAHVPARGREAQAVEDFREAIVENLRRFVRSKQAGNRQPMIALARQFSTHLLARHGTAADREWAKEFLQPRASAEPLLRRLSFTGIALGGGKDAETVDRFRWSLEHDRSLADVNLLFNAFHYGDVTFSHDGHLPPIPKHFPRAIPHVLRHIEQADHYASILDIECLTLIHLLEAGGPAAFRHASVISHLRPLLEDDSQLQLRVNPRVRRQLLDRFSPLLRKP